VLGSFVLSQGLALKPHLFHIFFPQLHFFLQLNDALLKFLHTLMHRCDLLVFVIRGLLQQLLLLLIGNKVLKLI